MSSIQERTSLAGRARQASMSEQERRALTSTAGKARMAKATPEERRLLASYAARIRNSVYKPTPPRKRDFRDHGQWLRALTRWARVQLDDPAVVLDTVEEMASR